jgi:hypothetical protein
MSEVARLINDVGKYVARTARNLPDGLVDDDLIAMMVRDLYELQPGRRASRVFEELSVGMPGMTGVRALLAEVDALEPRVRGGDQDAVRRAAALACEIERGLRALVQARR